MNRTACIVQGDYRRGTDEVLNSLKNKFDLVVISTWEDDVQKFPKGEYKIIGVKKPENFGITNRNLQRLGVSEGLRVARAEGCNYVLKWRTDLLPTKLDVNQLIQLATTNIPNGVDSRIVTCAFRNLSVKPDEYSSIPDLFAFGSIKMMSMLWDDEGFDYTQSLNIPALMRKKYSKTDIEAINGVDYCAETEVYAFFKYRLQALLSKDLTHREIAENYLSLIDDKQLGILWFGRDKGFRSIKQAYHIPWWRMKNGKAFQPAVIVPGYEVKGLLPSLKRKLGPILVKKNIFLQTIQYFIYRVRFQKS